MATAPENAQAEAAKVADVLQQAVAVRPNFKPVKAEVFPLVVMCYFGWHNRIEHGCKQICFQISYGGWVKRHRGKGKENDVKKA